MSGQEDERLADARHIGSGWDKYKYSSAHHIAAAKRKEAVWTPARTYTYVCRLVRAQNETSA